MSGDQYVEYGVNVAKMDKIIAELMGMVEPEVPYKSDPLKFERAVVKHLRLKALNTLIEITDFPWCTRDYYGDVYELIEKGIEEESDASTDC